MDVGDGFRLGIGLAIAYFVFKLLGALCLGAFGFYAKDDSDSPTKNSGLRVHVDHKTGIEYLSTIGGGIVVRAQKPKEN